MTQTQLLAVAVAGFGLMLGLSLYLMRGWLEHVEQGLAQVQRMVNTLSTQDVYIQSLMKVQERDHERIGKMEAEVSLHRARLDLLDERKEQR